MPPDARRTSPLATARPGDVDFVVVRENTEGEYSSIGGRMFEGTDREIVVQETVMTRVGVDRVLRFAFELARARPAPHLTSATKSNGISITMPYWDERVAAMAASYPDVRRDQFHIDILAAQLRAQARPLRRGRGQQPVRRHPLRPRPGLHRHDRHRARAPTSTRTREFPSLFEPVHGSAPDIAGRGIANPVGQIWSGAMMLEHLGHPEAGAAVLDAIETVLARGPEGAPLTPDIGGTGTTLELGTAVAQALG